MADTIIEPDYYVVLPEEVRPHIVIGQRYSVTIGHQGKLILTPTEPQPAVDVIDEILRRTAGLWRSRNDIPRDGVEYVNQLRQARRLEQLADSPNGN